jgi:[acyl-carrier-protein] S-malonyltransferase
MTQMAFLFPGQGSQKVGMGLDFVEHYPELKERWFDAADDILQLPLSRLCFEGPEQDLMRTENTQPAIFLVSMAVLDVLRSAGIEPQAAAGHSLGEYSALACSGALEFADALRLVRRRGELMAEVNKRTPGTMAAIIGLNPEQVEDLCAQASDFCDGIVEPANYNLPLPRPASWPQGKEPGSFGCESALRSTPASCPCSTASSARRSTPHRWRRPGCRSSRM